MKQQKLISADVKLKVIAVNRTTGKVHETYMTYQEWNKLEKSFKFDWKALQI